MSTKLGLEDASEREQGFKFCSGDHSKLVIGKEYFRRKEMVNN